jgi:dolichyl-diphosphooligosaccharide--protein glycosyltransferase
MTTRAYRITLGALALLAFLLRTVPIWDRVIHPTFINFQETDAWYHVRLIDHLTAHFPFPLTWDHHVLHPGGQAVLVGPLFDFLAATVAWLAGLGSPSTRLTHIIAAIYPAVLGALIVLANAALARHLAGRSAALLTALFTALLPGYLLAVTSLGFTDHHALESLLSVVAVLLLQRDRPMLAGLAMAAYALTFTGAAAFLAVLVGWACLEQMYGSRPVRPFAVSCAIALPFALLFRHVLWMEYTVAVLVAGVVAPAAVSALRPRRRLWAPAFLLLAVAAILVFQTKAGEIAFRQLTATSPISQTVGELHSLTHSKGFFSLEGAWREAAGVLPLALAGLLAFGTAYPLAGLWTAVSFLLAAMQIRMVYYAAPMAALFAGLAAARFLSTPGVKRWLTIAFLIVAVAIPGVNAALDPPENPGAVTPDWLLSLEWLRENTPEPFAESPEGYGVVAWWDFGYWITTVGHRIPMTNPAQTNAGRVAAFFLATTEDQALEALGPDARARYVMVDSRLPMNPRSPRLGMFPTFFPYAPQIRQSDYLRQVLLKDDSGNWKPMTIFLPAYYESMAVRLAAFGGREIAAGDGAIVCVDSDRRVTQYRLVSAPAPTPPAGCLLAGLEPLTSPVGVAALTRFRRVQGATNAVQIFEVAPRPIGIR